MTDKEKAWAYDGALKRAKAAIDIAADKDLVKGVVKTIFPLLRESEDERIRKSLVDYFGRYNPKDKWDEEFSFKDVLAYFERQKEQKQELPLMGGDTDTYFDDLRITTKPLTSREWFDEGIKYAQRLQKEQKPAEWSEEDKNNLNKLLQWDGIPLGLRSWVSGLPEKVGARPSWKPSEEQMEAFRSYIKDFQEKAEAAVGGWNNFDVMIRLFEQLKKL